MYQFPTGRGGLSGNRSAHYCLATFCTLPVPDLYPGTGNGELTPGKNPRTNCLPSVLFLELPLSLDRPGNIKFRGQPPSLAELFPRNCDLLWAPAPWKRMPKWYSLVLAEVPSNWRGILPELRVPPKLWKLDEGTLLPQVLTKVQEASHTTWLNWEARRSERDHVPHNYWGWLVLTYPFLTPSNAKVKGPKACAAHKEEAHTSQEQPKPAHPFIWLNIKEDNKIKQSF